jgi:sulfatase modifying factor 1
MDDSGKACAWCEKRAGKVGLTGLRRCMFSIGAAFALFGCNGGVDESTSIDSADSSQPAQDGAGHICQNGACVCGLTCGGTCVDPKTDNSNCGACGTTCSAAQVCIHGNCVTPASCQVSAAGTTNCGSASESCCTTLEVTGGTYYRTYNTAQSISGPPDGGWTDEADPATVSGLRIDKYDVTVGRFRHFVTAWNGGSGYTPPSGSGIHTHLNGGRGLANSGSAGTYETGWSTTWNSDIAPTNANLGSCSPDSTWTNTASTQENLPIDCVNWYEAYAFCIWDGGFLPSEAEWEYTAAGGSEQLEYPWGSTAPGTACPGTGCEYAIYSCDYPSGPGNCAGMANIAPVGTATLGAGLWGQLDMAGNVWQWDLDWWEPSSYVNPCKDCADLSAASARVLRGGSFDVNAYALLPPGRSFGTPSDRDNGIPADGIGDSGTIGFGFRCARTP